MLKEIHSFLGANSELGFYSLYEDFFSNIPNTYIIKGGPGTGKSTLMKKAAFKAQEKGFSVEYIHCSADPNSLDGVYIKEKNLCILDGTPPHTIEPPVPGAIGKIINLYEFWDSEFLKKHSLEIKHNMNEISSNYERAYLYIGAVGKLQRDLNKIGLSMLNKPKFKGYFERLCAKHIKPTENTSKEDKRFISTVSHNGYETIKNIWDNEEMKCLVIEDEFGISSKALELFKYKALKNGHHVITCYSPIIPTQTEHLIIPTANLAILTSNSLNTFEPKPYCRINITRFFYEETQKAHKEKINFIIKARKEIINEAVKLLQNSYDKHNNLEEIYKTAVDFNSLTVYSDNLINKLID